MAEPVSDKEVTEATVKVEEFKTIRNLVYLAILLVVICLGHAGVSDFIKWKWGPAVVAPAAAAPLSYTCGAPDDMGFTKCRRQTP